jgi:hypothetical protein
VYRLHIQEHPFKSDITIKDIESGLSLKEAYESTNPILPIENARFIVVDEIVEDIDYIPNDDEIVYVKLIPASEERKWWYAAGAIVAVAAIPFMAVSLTLAAGVALVGGAIVGVAGIMDWVDKKLTPEDLGEAQSLHGGNGSRDVWNPVPVVFGEHLLAPSFAAPDYSELVPSNKDDVADTYYLHQLYVLGQKPLIVDNISIGDNLLYTREKLENCTATMTRISATQARVSSSRALNPFLSGQPKVCLTGFTRPQNNKEFNITNLSTYYVDIETTDDIVDETSGDLAVTFSYLKDSGYYNEVQGQIIDNGVFDGTPYPKIVNELYIGREIPYAPTNDVVITTPSDVHKMDFTLSIPSGLYKVVDGEKKTASVHVKMYVKPVTSDTWIYIDTYGFDNYRTVYNRDKQWTYDFGARGQYNVRFVKVEQDIDGEDGSNAIQINRVIVYKADENGDELPPVSDLIKDDFVFLALRIKATDQLNDTINNLNCVIRQAHRVYDSASTAENEYDKWVVGYSSNPASVFVDVLTNPIINRYPVGTNGWANPETLPIDWTVMAEWYNFCETIGYTCNGVVTSTTTTKDELEKIATTGRATLVLKDNLYGVYIDKEKLPVQLFTPRNSYDFTAKRTYFEPFDGVRVKYVDKDIGYQSNEAIVQPEASTSNNKFDEISLTYITDRANASRFGNYYYNIKTLRQETFTFSTDFEYIVCTTGDRIKLQHDVPLIGLASARIKSKLLSGSNLTGVLLDEFVTMEPDTDYGIEVRTKDASGIFTIIGPLAVANTAIDEPVNVNILTFLVPQGNINLVSNGDIVAFGNHHSETEDLLITDISCGDDLTATITTVKYDASVFVLDEFPTWEPVVANVGSASRGVTFQDSTSRSISILQSTVANLSNNRIFNEEQPTPPYSRGDIWRRGISMYICNVARTSSEQFVASDWELTTSDTFQTISKDIFGEQFPEHRWYMYPDGDIPILYSDLFSVFSGEATKDNMLSDNVSYWNAEQSEGKVLIPTTPSLDAITIKELDAKLGLDQTAYIVGRYNRNGWISSSFTNIYPVSNTITLDAGTYVLQCYTGTIDCNKGLAYADNPLVFETSGETITFVPNSVTYPSLTKTSFIPPYVETSYTAVYYTYNITQPSISGVVNIYNKPTTTVPIAEMYYDANNYIMLALGADFIRIIVTGSAISAVKDIPLTDIGIPDNVLSFTLTYDEVSASVTGNINGYDFSFNDVEVFGVLGYYYVGTDHNTTTYFNNQVYEVTYN